MVIIEQKNPSEKSNRDDRCEMINSEMNDVEVADFTIDGIWKIKKLSAKLILNRNHKNNRWKLARGVFRKLSNLGINIRFLSIGGMEAKYKLAYCNE